MHDGIRIDVFEPVIPQFQFVVAQQRIRLNSGVGSGAGVILESAQRQFRGLHAAADHRPALQNQTAIAGFRQVGGCDQAVVPGASNDNVEAICLGCLLRPGEGGKSEGRDRGTLDEVASCYRAHRITTPPPARRGL